MSEPIRPSFFQATEEGALITVAVDDKPVEVLIKDRDLLRLFSMMQQAFDEDDWEAINMAYRMRVTQ